MLYEIQYQLARQDMTACDIMVQWLSGEQTSYSLFEFREEILAGTVNLMNIYARGAHKSHQRADSYCLAKLIQHQTAL